MSGPNVHLTRLLATPEGGTAEIDLELVDVVQRLWALGITTTASCQDFGEGVAGQRAHDPQPPRGGYDGFITYYTGFAWLKLPTGDATRLLNSLARTELREQVTTRWQPGSWRIHTPFIYTPENGFGHAADTQIHFPRAHIAELTDVLTAL